LVALGFEFGNVFLADFQFFIRRHEQANNDEPDGEEEKGQEDTIPTLPNGSFTSRPKIVVIHFQRILPPYCALSPNSWDQRQWRDNIASLGQRPRKTINTKRQALKARFI
jgi:hypothetical protein